MTDLDDYKRLADELDTYAKRYSGDWAKACLTVSWYELQLIVTALRAASVKAGEVVAVRPLEWSEHRGPDGNCCYDHVTASSTIGVYSIEWKGWKDNDSYDVSRDEASVTFEYTLDAAKAAAQADYESRIRSALVEVPAVKGEPEPVAWPANLNPRTLDLVQRFALALANKLRLAEEKYGHTDGWSRGDWEAECRDHLYQHLEKGDPRDVAAYCAFMWHHGWITYQPLYTAPPADAGMREALEPFARIADLYSDPDDDDLRIFADMDLDAIKLLTVGACRKARAALTAPGATTKSDGGGGTRDFLTVAIDENFYFTWPKGGASEVQVQDSGGTKGKSNAAPVASVDANANDDGQRVQTGNNVVTGGESAATNLRPSDPSPARSDVTVEELAKIIEAQIEYDIHGVTVWPRGDRAARALIETHEIRRKK